MQAGEGKGKRGKGREEGKGEKGEREEKQRGRRRREGRRKGKAEHARERKTTADKFLPPSRTVLFYHLMTLQLEQSLTLISE